MANINHALGIVTVAALATALPQQQIKADDAGAYHVAQVWQIGGKGGWDYVTVDSRNKLLYLPRTTHTLVVDANILVRAVPHGGDRTVDAFSPHLDIRRHGTTT